MTMPEIVPVWVCACALPACAGAVAARDTVNSTTARTVFMVAGREHDGCQRAPRYGRTIQHEPGGSSRLLSPGLDTSSSRRVNGDELPLAGDELLLAREKRGQRANITRACEVGEFGPRVRRGRGRQRAAGAVGELGRQFLVGEPSRIPACAIDGLRPLAAVAQRTVTRACERGAAASNASFARSVTRGRSACTRGSRICSTSNVSIPIRG